MFVAVLLIALLTPAAHAPAAIGATSECVDGWQATAIPASFRYVLPLGTASLAGEPEWLFGIPTVNAPQYPAIARWVDEAWQATSVPWKGRGSINAISPLSASAAWAVGGKGSAISARWNGSEWQAVPVPGVGGRMSVFTGVSATTFERAWAVGARLLGGQLKPLVMERRPRGWIDRTPPTTAGAEGGLKAIERSPDGRLWIAGWRTVNGEPRPWLLTRNGPGWQNMPMAPVGAGRAVIMSLAFASNGEGWLAGHVETAGGAYEPLLQRWDGSAWANQPTPWTAADSVYLTGVSADSGRRVTISGTRVRDGKRSGVMAVLDGGAWHVRPTAGLEWLMGTDGLHTGSVVVGMTGAGEAAAIVNCPPVATPGPLAWMALDSTPDGDAALDEHGELSSGPRAAAGAGFPASVTAAGVTAVDVTQRSGLTLLERTYSGVAGDFDGDSYADLFVNRHGTTTRSRFLLGSASGVFSQSSYEFPKQDRHSCSAADVDLDGILDMFCPVGAFRGTRTTANELVLRPVASGGTLATNAYGLLDSFGRGRESTFLNLDGDAYPDLYVTNWPDRIDAISSSNRLYRNAGGTHFVSAAEWGADVSMGGECAVAADLDADGDDELLLCASENHGGLAPGARLLLNSGRQLVPRTTERGLAPFGDRDIEVADFDGDGRLDVAQLGANLLRVSLADETGIFRARYETTLNGAVAMAIGDVNLDGRPDIYVLQQSAGHLMLINGGLGTSFTSLVVAASQGSADDVLALDYDNNGRTDFFSLNGRSNAGPLKLIAFFGEGDSPSQP